MVKRKYLKETLFIIVAAYQPTATIEYSPMCVCVCVCARVC